MRIFGLSLATRCCLSLGSPAFAQQVGSDGITADQRDIGKVQTRIQKFDQALANLRGCNQIGSLLQSSPAKAGAQDK